MSGLMNRLRQRWAGYQPNKGSLYRAIGYSVFLTVVLGFTAGGWTTRGGAEDRAQQARVDYAAALCADRFQASDFTGQRLADLKQVAGRYQRRSVLEKGDWVAVPKGARSEFVREVALACGERLVATDAEDTV